MTPNATCMASRRRIHHLVSVVCLLFTRKVVVYSCLVGVRYSHRLHHHGQYDVDLVKLHCLRARFSPSIVAAAYTPAFRLHHLRI